MRRDQMSGAAELATYWEAEPWRETAQLSQNKPMSAVLEVRSDVSGTGAQRSQAA